MGRPRSFSSRGDEHLTEYDMEQKDNIVYVGIDPNTLQCFQGKSLNDCLQELFAKFCSKEEQEEEDVKLFSKESIVDKIKEEDKNDEEQKPANGISVFSLDGNFHCPKCDFQSHLKKSVTRHLREIHGTLNVICDVCAKKYRTAGQLRKHVKEK